MLAVVAVIVALTKCGLFAGDPGDVGDPVDGVDVYYHPMVMMVMLLMVYKILFNLTQFYMSQKNLRQGLLL